MKKRINASKPEWVKKVIRASEFNRKKFFIWLILFILVSIALSFAPVVSFVTEDYTELATELSRNAHVKDKIEHHAFQLRKKIVSHIDAQSTIFQQKYDSIIPIDDQNVFKLFYLNKTIDKLSLDTTIALSMPQAMSGPEIERFKQGTFLLRFDSVYAHISVSREKLLSSLPELLVENKYREVIMYADFFEREYSINNGLNPFKVLVLCLLAIVAATVLYFSLSSLGTKQTDSEMDRDTLKTEGEELGKVYDEVRNQEGLKKKLISRIERKLEELSNLAKLADMDYYIYDEMIFYKRKALSAETKANVLLILGLVVAVAGIIIFILTLPESSTIRSYDTFLYQSIRPAFMLFFIEGVALYLLKQHRVSLKDSMYFTRLYQQMTRLGTTLSLADKDPRYSDTLNQLLCATQKDDSKEHEIDDSDTVNRLMEVVNKLKKNVQK